MRFDRALLVSLIAALVILPACSAARTGQPIQAQDAEVRLLNQAWEAARSRLHSMCPYVPKTASELKQALRFEHENGCYARLAKDSHVLPLDDWHWHWLPPYRVVVAVHDEELRKRLIPTLDEEYMLGLSHYLAEKVDHGEITPKQFRYAFNASWTWLHSKLRNEHLLLQEKAHAVENPDAYLQDRVGTIAGGLATAATLALMVSADDREYQPGPANCYAHPKGEQRYIIHCH
jgi:hypothetical protein